jgi:penicillin amidase
MGKSSNIAKPYTILVARRTGHTIRLLKEQPTGWFDEGWNTVIQKALVETIRILRIRYGNNHKNWAWGNVRQLILRHPFGERKMFSHIFNRGPFPLGGDANTIAQAAAPLDNPTGNPLAIPSMRMVIDIGKWENSRFSIPGGQSGNPMSPHYDDLLPLWIRGEGVAIPWSRESVLQEMKSNLKLLPA